MPPSRAASPLLLASVVDAEEAATALPAGADILDAKDPLRGSLGACTPAVLRAIVRVRDRARDAPEAIERGPRRVAVSAALGDAADLPGTFALAAAGAAACGVEYVKIGLRGLLDEDRSVAFLSAVVEGARSAAPDVRVIAAAYADATEVGSLPPRLLPRVAERSGASGCLIDTARKDGRSLFDHLDAGALAGFVEDCRGRALLCGLAGSLRAEHLPRLLELGADVIGVRGALCAGGRNGRLDGRLVRSFCAILRGDPAMRASSES